MDQNRPGSAFEPTQISTLNVDPNVPPPSAETPPQDDTTGGTNRTALYPESGPNPPGTLKGEATRNESGATDPTDGVGVEGELVVWEAKYAYRNFAGRIMGCTLLTLLLIFLASYTWFGEHRGWTVPSIFLGIVVALIWFSLITKMIPARLGHFYRLTDRRLFVSTGVMHRERDQMELLRIQDVFTRQQTLIERLLDLGTVIIVPDQKTLPTLHILGVKAPKQVMDLIWHHARAEQDVRNVRVEHV